MMLKSKIHALSVLIALLAVLVGVTARAAQPTFTAASQADAPPPASVGTTAAPAGNPFTLMGFVYAPDGGAGDATTANSYAGLFAYRAGIADQIGHQNPPPNDITDADGMGTPAYFFTDVGSSDWTTPPAEGHDVIAILETYEGLNGWTGPSYAASLDKVIDQDDITGSGIEFTTPATMELIPTPHGITLINSIVLTWTGLTDPAGNVLHYTVYRSEDSGPYGEVGTSTSQISGGTIYYTDTDVTAGSCYSYTIAVNYRWGGGGGAPEYYTTAGRSNPPAAFRLPPLFEVTISGPTTGTVNTAYTFTATVRPVTATLPITYVWQATGQYPVTHTGGLSDTVAFTWTTPGTQAITVTATNAGGTDTDTHAITITDVPIAGLSAKNDSPTPLGRATTLTATVTEGTNVTYVWAFGDDATGSGAVVTHTYTATGTHTAVVTASNSISVLTATMTVTITDALIAELSATNDSPTVLGRPTTLTATVATGSNVAYEWAFGDGETGSGAVVTHTYPATGTYTAVVTASNSVSVLTATTTVTIIPVQAATVRIVPASRDVDTQATYNLIVTVEDAQDLGGFEFDLTFNPALLRVGDVRLGSFLGSTGRGTGELGPDIDNDAGLVTYGAFSFGPQDGPNGAGTLAIVAFTTTITPGVSALDLQNVQITNTDAHIQVVQAVSGSITVLPGPRIGNPTFAGSVPSDEPLTVTVRITNTTSGTGVPTATLRYGYTSPYTQSSVPGSGPGGDGNGEWTFTIPPQGDVHEEQTLYFSLAAQNGNTPPGEAVSISYTVTITDDDTAPPVFSNPAPATVVTCFSITLQVDIADAESGIRDSDFPTDSVYVEWDTDGEFDVDTFRAGMDWVTGTTYAIAPPVEPLGAGITVTWHVYAEDDDNSPSGAWSPEYETRIIDTIFGDLDCDCDVDIDDIMKVVARWNSETGDSDYDSRYDFDDDGDIDVVDVMIVAAEWGNTCPEMAAVCAAPAAHLDQEGADVRFAPPMVVVQVGVSFTMNITIAQVTDLGGFEFDLLFDPDVITVTNVHLGDFLASSGNNTMALGPRYEGSGRLVFGGFGYGEYEGASGYGSLATLELTLLKDAETVLRLEDVQLVTSDAERAPLHSIGEGHVQTRVRVYLPLVLRSHPQVEIARQQNGATSVEVALRR